MLCFLGRSLRDESGRRNVSVGTIIFGLAMVFLVGLLFGPPGLYYKVKAAMIYSSGVLDKVNAGF